MLCQSLPRAMHARRAIAGSAVWPATRTWWHYVLKEKAFAPLLPPPDWRRGQS